MAHVCEVCNKGELSGNNVSHSHLKTKRSWKPNIQRVRAVVDGEVKRINVCTRCLRSGKVGTRPLIHGFAQNQEFDKEEVRADGPYLFFSFRNR